MSLSLRLELKSGNKVLVTNSETKEQKTVSLGFLANITGTPLSDLIQYKYYELLINAERYWGSICRRSADLESLANNPSNLQPNVTKSYKSLSLNLQLKTGDHVLVTNSITREQKEVTLAFLRNITREPLALLVQYQTYDLMVNAKKYWQSILRFDSKIEKDQEIALEQKFRNIMVNDNWITITDHDKQMYSQALAWAGSYNPDNRKIRKGAILTTGAGAVTGALVGNTIGGVGIAAAGTAIGVGTIGLTTIGAVAGLAVYGIGKAIS